MLRKSLKRKRQRFYENPKKSEGRKNYWAFLLSILLWWGVGATIVWSAPNTITIFVFMILLSLALIVTFSILFTNTRRGVLLAGVIILFMLLRLIKLGNTLNLALLIGAAISFELYHKD